MDLSSTSTDIDPFRLPTRSRIVWGLRAGLRVGAYLAAVTLALDLFPVAPFGVLERPVVAASSILAGCTLALLLFYVFRPKARSSLVRLLLTLVCFTSHFSDSQSRGLAGARWDSPQV